MPDWSELKLRLAIVDTKSGKNSEAIEKLSAIDRPQTTCLKGLLYAQQQQYTKARSIWSQSDLDLVREHWRSTSNTMLEKFRVV
jgi:predicted negative regulator of RcsB-dependent stress response